jgi:hypothetical protein
MRHTSDVLTKTSSVLKETESRFEATAAPLRKAVFERFPILFILLTTFGVTAVVHSVDMLITQMVWLHERPLVLLCIGITVLMATGTLYKKLGARP